MNTTLRGNASIMGVGGDRDHSKQLFQVVAESGGILVHSCEDGARVLNADVDGGSSDEISAIWMSQSEPPIGEYKVWCRHALTDQMPLEIARAYDDKEKYGLQQIAILDIASASLSTTFHALIGSDGVVRTFMLESDIYAHLVDDFVGGF